MSPLSCFVPPLPAGAHWRLPGLGAPFCRPPATKRSRALWATARLESNAETQGAEGAVRTAEEMEARRSNWRVVNSCLCTEARRSGAGAALALLREFDARDEASIQNFNQTVHLLLCENRVSDALELCVECAQRGIANVITFRPIISYCCSKGDGKTARRVWKVMRDANVEGDMYFYAELIGSFVKSRDLVNAHSVLSTVKRLGRRPHIVLYNTLLKGYARNADSKKALSLVKSLRELGAKSDETTYNTLLNACVRARDEKSLNEAISMMQLERIKPGVPTFNTLLKMYSKEGDLADAIRIFDDMQVVVKPSIVTYNTMIDACAHRGQMEKAAYFFDMMVKEGLAPDICTLTSLLKGFGRAHDPVRALELYEAMKRGGYLIEERTRYAVIHACLRGNDHSNVNRIMQEIIDTGRALRPRTIVWALEVQIGNDDEAGALEAIKLAWASNCKFLLSDKLSLLRSCESRGGFDELRQAIAELEEG